MSFWPSCTVGKAGARLWKAVYWSVLHFCDTVGLIMEGSKTSDYNLNIRTGHVAFFSPTPSIFKAGAYITPNSSFTGGKCIRLHAASPGVLLFSHMQYNFPETYKHTVIGGVTL